MNHGHVIPNEDGSRARCGGPGICSVCSSELAYAIKNKVHAESKDCWCKPVLQPKTSEQDADHYVHNDICLN